VHLYKYIYIFNDKYIKKKIKDENPNSEIKEIDYYEIEYKNNFKPASIDVKIPESRAILNRQKKYLGFFEQKENKLIIRFENDDDYIMAIFNEDLKNNDTIYLCGVIIGIADFNQAVPMAKKAILTKEIVKNNADMYKILNETEILIADENIYKLDQEHSFDYKHFKNYISKIDNISSLLKDISSEKYFNSFYKQLGFYEFYAIKNMLTKMVHEKSYFVSYRKRILINLLNSVEIENITHLYIVMPISDDNIFEKISAKKLRDKFYILAKNGLKIKIVFVSKCYNCQLNEEFLESLSNMYHSGIDIKFVTNSKIENETESIDFILTQKDDFLISKALKRENIFFHIVKDKIITKEHKIFYEKIYKRASTYTEVVKEGILNLPKKTKLILQQLVGEWYFHFYGSRENEKGLTQLWRVKITIDSEELVNLYSECGATILDSGKLYIKEKQTMIVLNSIQTHNTSYISFDHSKDKLFWVNMIDKQYQTNLDMYSMGIFSREKLEECKARELLGDVNNVRILETSQARKRLL